MKNLESILEDALQSRALKHPFLSKFAENDFEDFDHALSVFAYNYYEYSRNFQRYLCALISKVESKEHISLLLENLFEEAGNLHEEDIELLKEINIEREWVDGIEHPTLFKNFISKVTPIEDVSHGKAWSQKFLNELSASSQLRALGMLSIGTEGIVKYIYKEIIKGLRKCGQFSEQDIVFYLLHSEIDDEHSEIMMNILKELTANDEEGLAEVIDGVNKAIEIREEFWDNISVQINDKELV